MIDLTTVIFSQLPSVQNFMGVLFSELVNRRSLVVVLPPEISPEQVWASLREKLLLKDFHFEEIWLPKITGVSPVVGISELLNIEWPSSTPRTVLNFLINEGLPDIIQLAGFEELSQQLQHEWITFVKAWAEANQTRANYRTEPIPVVMILQARDLKHIPESDLYLAIHRWLKIPSALETHLTCRIIEPDTSQASLIKSQWREHVLPALAGNNLSLIEFLWNKLCTDVESILDHLTSYANECQWTTENLHTMRADEVIRVGGNRKKIETLPIAWYDLWANGLLIWTPEYGLELHPGALVLLGRKDLILHRLWRGQADLLLPLIDHARLLFCEHLLRLYGPEWPWRWHRPQSDEEYEAVKKNHLASR